MWITPGDVLFTPIHKCYVRIPISPKNEERVRRVLEVPGEARFGIVLRTVCASPKITFAPADEATAPQGLAVSGIRFSVSLNKLRGKIVQNRLRWLYLRWKLKKWQHIKDMFFE